MALRSGSLMKMTSLCRAAATIRILASFQKGDLKLFLFPHCNSGDSKVIEKEKLEVKD